MATKFKSAQFYRNRLNANQNSQCFQSEASRIETEASRLLMYVYGEIDKSNTGFVSVLLPLQYFDLQYRHDENSNFLQSVLDHAIARLSYNGFKVEQKASSLEISF